MALKEYGDMYKYSELCVADIDIRTFYCAYIFRTQTIDRVYEIPMSMTPGSPTANSGLDPHAAWRNWHRDDASAYSAEDAIRRRLAFKPDI